MNARTILAFSAVLGLLAAGDAAAQKLSLRIDKGLVTLDAENVTVDEVLARWIDTTGLNVVSKSGQGSDVPVSLHLEGVTGARGPGDRAAGLERLHHGRAP